MNTMYGIELLINIIDWKLNIESIWKTCFMSNWQISRHFPQAEAPVTLQQGKVTENEILDKKINFNELKVK